MREYFKSTARYLDLNVTFPHEEMLEEVKKVRDKFVPHRLDDGKGWLGLVLHGMGNNMTGSWQGYGITDPKQASKMMDWTEYAEMCPVTTNYFKNVFPCKKYGRLRVMLLEPGGYINFHTDSRIPIVDNISFVLNYPEGCEWKWGDGTPGINFVPGHAYALNISYSHGIWNNSDEDRYFVIAARHDSTDEWKSLTSDAAKAQNVTGEFITLDTLP